MTELQRARRIMDTAMALFGGDGDVLVRGTHTRSRGDFKAIVEVHDAKSVRLTLAGDDDTPLFEADIVAGRSARVTRWANGPWERRFVTADA